MTHFHRSLPWFVFHFFFYNIYLHLFPFTFYYCFSSFIFKNSQFCNGWWSVLSCIHFLVFLLIIIWFFLPDGIKLCSHFFFLMKLTLCGRKKILKIEKQVKKKLILRFIYIYFKIFLFLIFFLNPNII